MSATSLSSAAPPHALLCWLDDRYVYVEIPSSTGSPFVDKFPLCEAGLSKALNLLRLRYDELPSSMKNYTMPSIEPSMKNGKPPIQTGKQRDQALAVLRKMGLV